MKHSISSQKSEQNADLESIYKTLIDPHLKQVKQENYSDTFPELENWLYIKNLEINGNNKENERKLYKMKNFFLANKLRLVYTVIILAILIGACNMPVTQTESAGQMITLVVPIDNKDFHSMLNTLPWIKNAQITSNDNTNNGEAQVLYRIVLPNTTEEQVKAYAKELESLGGISSLIITSMDYDVKRPLYSAALEHVSILKGFFSISIDATGMSDEELQNEIARKLKEHHGIDMKFRFKTTTDGRRDITIENEHLLDLSKEPGTFELNIEDNNGREKIKLVTKKADPEMFKDKTDEEIRKMLKKEHPELQDRDIVIERDAGEVKVKINIDKKVIK